MNCTNTGLSIFLSFALVSCVVPLRHTYFVPNPSDGELERSSSCGFYKNSKNSLKRQKGDLSIRVTPSYNSNGTLWVSFFILYPTPDVAFNADKVEVMELTSAKLLKSTNTRISEYGPDRTHPYTLSVTLSFAETEADIQSLTIFIHQGGLTVKGQEINLEPFRFKQGTSIDLFYASINC